MDQDISGSHWTSVTGQPLELDLCDGFLGLVALCPQPAWRLMILREGNCCSVSTYEKLNQLGEGSRHHDNLIHDSKAIH